MLDNNESLTHLNLIDHCHVIEDKNQSDTERCAEIFHTIQHAYEILSDPQERAW